MTTAKTYNLQQIITGWIVNNNPSAVKQVLINNSLISSGANPSKKEMAKIIYSYYLSNGSGALFTILKEIPINPNTSQSQKMALANAYSEISSSNTGNSTPQYQSSSRVGEQSPKKLVDDILGYILGSEITVVQPTVTPAPTNSALIIGGLIAGVLLILGLAYFFIGRKAAA